MAGEAWKATPFEVAQTGQYLGPIEVQDNAGEWHMFEVVALPDRVLFGGACNVGFMESGFIRREDGEDMEDTLAALLADLGAYYNCGKQYVSRIVCNERM